MQVPSAAPTPNHEAERLRALLGYDPLATPPGRVFEELIALAREILRVPTAVVSLADVDPEWFRARYGFDVPVTPRAVALCTRAAAEGERLVVPDTQEDPRFRDHPLVTGEPHARFYAGFPLQTPDGIVLGTLCAMDRVPRAIEPRNLELVATLAQRATDQLEVRRRVRLLMESEAALRESQASQQALLDALPGLYFRLSSDGRFTAFHGLSQEELLALPSTFIGRSYREVLPPDVAKLVGSAMAEAARTGEVQEITYELALPGGPQHFVARIARSALSDYVSFAFNVTRRVLAERQVAQALVELEKGNAHLQSVLNQLHVGSLVVSVEGTVLFASEALEAMVSASPGGCVGRPWAQALRLGKADADALRAELARPAAARERLSVRLAANGAERHVEIDARDDPRAEGQHLFFLYDRTEVHRLRTRLDQARHGEMIAHSPEMQQVLRAIEDVAVGDWTVCIEGETGTGKELVARAVHFASRRADGPFIAVNCAGLTESLLASQLFGHRRGAFTGAVADQEGLFEAASGGTLFLDEIGDIPPAVQVGLLRVLEQREILRVGDTRPRKVDVRIVAATHRNLAEQVASGRFREDLLYRLRVARIAVPPLRERTQDIPLLAMHFLEQARKIAGKPRLHVDAAAMDRLAEYRWPGNVRELRNAVEHAVIRCRGDTIREADLPEELRRARPTEAVAAGVRAAATRQEIVDALARAEGNRSRAAKILGVSRATFYRRVHELGLDAPSAGP